jgi:hypothetical protein
MNANLYYKSIWIRFVYRYGARSSSTRLWLPTWLSSSWKTRGNDRAKIIIIQQLKFYFFTD